MSCGLTPAIGRPTVDQGPCPAVLQDEQVFGHDAGSGWIWPDEPWTLKSFQCHFVYFIRDYPYEMQQTASE